MRPKNPRMPAPAVASAPSSAASTSPSSAAPTAPSGAALTAPPPTPAGAPPARLAWRWLLDALVEDRVVEAEAARQVARRLGAGASSLHPLQRLGGAGLVRAEGGAALDTEALTQWLAGRAGLPYVRIDPLKADVARVADVMSVAYAEGRHALPIAFTATEAVVATAEPFDDGWVAEIEAHTKRRVKRVVANPEDIRRLTTEFYALARSVRAAQKAGEVSAANTFEQLVELGGLNALEGAGGKAPDANDRGVVQLCDWLWQFAFEQRASDIHLEPRRDTGAVRFRIDGVLHTVYRVPLAVLAAIVARVKLLGRMDVVERRRPLDGRIKTRRADGSEVEMRLATLPTAFGEKMVMRIFDPGSATKSLEALGMEPEEADAWRGLIARPHGIVLVTGPTGSGKTTTLYATLKALATEEVNVCTLEDPIEMVEPALNQTQVQPALDMGFAEGLRALMRQDPDIIMVGEIRDLATAEMAIQAALTGHLVFSTLHTNDAASAVTRLADLGVPQYLIAATLNGVLAQRLVRTLCAACKARDREAPRDALDQLAKPWRLSGGHRAYRPVGCLECRHTGYRGRVGLYELLVPGEAARACIAPRADAAALFRQAVKEGMRPLRLAGARKVAEGLTTIEEVLRSTPSIEP
jgi:general secretion pathway protein E